MNLEETKTKEPIVKPGTKPNVDDPTKIPIVKPTVEPRPKA